METIRTRCAWAESHPLYLTYHDDEYGVPLHDDNLLLERLALEQMQAGLSWLIVLKKRDAIRTAFDKFQIPVVANYTESDVDRLCSDAGIIRNRKKIEAIIANANRLLEFQRNGSSFDAWLVNNAARKLDLPNWVKAFKQEFKFVGSEIVNEFLLSIGVFPIKHEPNCWLTKTPHQEFLSRG